MSDSSLWALADDPPARSVPERRWRWTIGAVPVVLLIALLGIGVMIPAGLGNEARLALFGFGTAVVLWSLTQINAAYVALGVVLLLVLGGALEQEQLFTALESDVIWLMIGAFILGTAVQDTGLAARLTGLVAKRARSVSAMMWLVTLVLLPTAFLIPSTSGRAAVALPVFRSLSDAAGSAKVTRALALLIPTVILVSTVASLTGAGSHLIANDLLGDLGGTKLSFVQWLLFGLPFALIASAVTTWIIGRLFLDKDLRAKSLSIETTASKPFSRDEWITLMVILASVGLWSTEHLHGLQIATVSVLAALILTLPGIGVIAWKDGLKAVNWNLIVFVGAALVLGQALIGTGAAKWLIGLVFSASGLTDGGSSSFILLALALITLTSHLYMTSHTARAAALTPALLYLAGTLKLNPAAVMFIGSVGMDYCLTFPVSSKALLMFQEADPDAWAPADLLRLSAILLPVHALLIIAVYFGWWQHVGLKL